MTLLVVPMEEAVFGACDWGMEDVGVCQYATKEFIPYMDNIERMMLHNNNSTVVNVPNSWKDSKK